MARRRVFLVTAMVLAALVAGVDAPLPAEAQTGVKAGYIVVFRDSVNSDQKADELEQREGFRSEFRYHHALKGFAAQLTPSQSARLAGDPDVSFLTPDRIVEAVGTVPIGAGDIAPTGVRRIEAATTATARQASTVNVAVIDTGVDLTHPDLNAASGVNCVRSGSSAQDDNGHGTHVAGTIAARNNGSGVVGVVPGTKGLRRKGARLFGQRYVVAGYLRDRLGDRERLCAQHQGRQHEPGRLGRQRQQLWQHQR